MLVIIFPALTCVATPISELGRPSEPVLVCSALLLGALIGHALDSSRRQAFGVEQKKHLVAVHADARAEEATAISAAKDNFIASLSHDMRAPSSL